MGMRFRKSLKLAPGLRMNFSGSGVSLSAGPRGASVSYGKRGTYLNTGIPGTGLYARESLDGLNRLSPSSSTRETTNVQITVRLEDDGTIRFVDENGNPAPESWIKAVKQQKGDVLKDIIQRECDKINQQVEALGDLYQFTPNPKSPPQYIPLEFGLARPKEPQPAEIGFFASLFKSKRERIEKANNDLHTSYLKSIDDWEKSNKDFLESENKRKKFIEQDIYTNTSAMLTHLENCLQDISWSKETLISFDLIDDGKRVLLDVDLPEIEDMPNKTASVPSRGMKLSIKEISNTQVQKLYMRHVHAVGFRIIGEVFASLPASEEVVLSTYTQRPDTATGQLKDDYLYSVRVNRSDWNAIDFNNLAGLDVIEAFLRFELSRDMSKTGVFKTIMPIA